MRYGRRGFTRHDDPLYGATFGSRCPCFTALTPPTYDEAIHISIRGECYLKCGEGDRAASYALQSLKLLDMSRARDVVMTIVDLGEAYVQCTEVGEAARLLGDAGEISAGNSSVRLIGRLD